LKVRSDAGASSGYSLLDVQNNSGTALYVAGDNKVGIGTTSPSELLHVSGLSSPAIRVTATNTPVSVSLQADDATGFLSTVTNHPLVFRTNNAERMRIDTSGNLLLGTTSATGSGASSGKQVIQFNGVATNGIYFDDTRTAAGTSVAAIFGRGSTAVGRLDTTLNSVVLTSLSDERVKNNIVDAPSASDDIDAIQVRSFDWKSDGSHQKYGMVAQELIEVAPEAVSVPENPEEMMGVDYSKLVPMLIKEIQSLRNRVATLEGN
jgi:hypothetical protein